MGGGGLANARQAELLEGPPADFNYSAPVTLSQAMNPLPRDPAENPPPPPLAEGAPTPLTLALGLGGGQTFRLSHYLHKGHSYLLTDGQGTRRLSAQMELGSIQVDQHKQTQIRTIYDALGQSGGSFLTRSPFGLQSESMFLDGSGQPVIGGIFERSRWGGSFVATVWGSDSVPRYRITGKSGSSEYPVVERDGRGVARIAKTSGTVLEGALLVELAPGVDPLYPIGLALMYCIARDHFMR